MTGLTTTPQWPPRLVRRVGALALALATATGLACSYRPPRFADAPPVWRVGDDAPIPLPRLRRMPKEFYYSDVYVRRALVEGLDPNRVPYAVDVNSWDEVPPSSWYRSVADTRHPLAGYERDGPPVLPLRRLAVRTETAVAGAEAVLDARGLRYELERDPEDRPEMRTAAAAIASRLLWSLGYWTPEVWVIRGPDGTRVSATRWADGVDLGPTPMAWRRPDDANDQLRHVDRRTLRVLGMVAAWLKLDRLTRDMARDGYVGLGGQGHVRHHLVGWSGALGVDAFVQVQKEAADPDRQSRNVFFRLATLGLSPKPPPPTAQTEWPSLGQLEKRVLPEDYKPSPPFEPRDRLIASDAYWLAKRIADLPDAALDAAIEAAELSDDDARHRLGVILRARRKQVVDFGFSLTTPCDALRVSGSRRGKPRLVLVDRAVAFGTASAFTSRYELVVLDRNAEPLASPAVVAPHGSLVTLPLPTRGWLDGGYRIAQIVALRREQRSPRPLQVHLLRAGDTFRILGIRH